MVGGRVFIGVRNSMFYALDAATGAHLLYALDGATGVVRWSWAIGPATSAGKALH